MMLIVNRGDRSEYPNQWQHSFEYEHSCATFIVGNAAWEKGTWIFFWIMRAMCLRRQSTGMNKGVKCFC